MYFKCGSKEICFHVAFLKLIHLHVSDVVETATSIETKTWLKRQDRDFIKKIQDRDSRLEIRDQDLNICRFAEIFLNIFKRNAVKSLLSTPS